MSLDKNYMEKLVNGQDKKDLNVILERMDQLSVSSVLHYDGDLCTCDNCNCDNCQCDNCSC